MTPSSALHIASLALLFAILSTTVGAAPNNHNDVARPVWNILHGNEGPITLPSIGAFKDSGVITLEVMKENIAKYNINAVELDMLYHEKSDEFFLAHDQYACDIPAESAMRVGCYELIPYLKAVEASPSVHLLWVDPKGMPQWGNKTLADLADLVRAHIHTKEIWWGLGSERSLQDRDLELLSVDGMPENEGVSFDYGKCCEYRCTIQDLYLRARRAGIKNVAYANKPGFMAGSCTELNKALAYRAEGKLSRVFSFTFDSQSPIQKLYELEDGETMSEGCGEDGDEEYLVGAVDGVISNAGNGAENHEAVINNHNDAIRAAIKTDRFWVDQTTDGNLIANCGADMPTLASHRASSWKWTGNSKPLSYSGDMCKGIPAHSGKNYFAVGQTSTEECAVPTEIYQDTVIRAYEPEIVAGLTNVTFSAFFMSQNPHSTVSMTITFLDDEATVISSPTPLTPSVSPGTNATWLFAGKTIAVPRDARIVRTIIRGSRCSTTPADPCSELVDSVSMKLEVEQLDAPLPYDWKSTKDIGCCDEDFDWQLPAVILAATILNAIAARLVVKAYQHRKKTTKVVVLKLEEDCTELKNVVEHDEVVVVVTDEDTSTNATSFDTTMDAHSHLTEINADDADSVFVYTNPLSTHSSSSNSSWDGYAINVDSSPPCSVPYGTDDADEEEA